MTTAPPKRADEDIGPYAKSFRFLVGAAISRPPLTGWLSYWCQTYDEIARVFPMFPLSVEGIEEGMKKLLSR